MVVEEGLAQPGMLIIGSDSHSVGYGCGTCIDRHMGVLAPDQIVPSRFTPCMLNDELGILWATCWWPMERQPSAPSADVSLGGLGRRWDRAVL